MVWASIESSQIVQRHYYMFLLGKVSLSLLPWDRNILASKAF